MTTSEKSNIRRRQEADSLTPATRYFGDIFEDFRREMENMFRPWTHSIAD